MSKLIKKIFHPVTGNLTEIEVTDIRVTTNLDHKYNHWVFPEKFYAIPEVGDYMDSNDGRILKVCSRRYMLDGSIQIEVTGRPRE
jgi:hypothetical protein